MNDFNMEKELQLTIQLLKDSFSSKNSETNKAVSSKLNELATNHYSHIQILLKAIILQSPEITPNLRTSISIYLKNLMQALQKKFSDSQLLEIINFLINAIIFTRLPSACLSSLHLIIRNIASTNSFMSNVNYIKDILEFLSKTIVQSPTDKFLVQGLEIIRLTTTLVQSKSINFDSITDVMPSIIAMIDYVFKVVNVYINPQSGIEMNFVNIMKAIYDLLYLLLKKLESPNTTLQHYNYLYDKYGNFTCEFIKLVINNNDLNNIIYLTDNHDLNDSINTLKGKALQFLSKFIQRTNSLINHQCLIPCSDLIQIINKSLSMIINSNLSLILDANVTPLKSGLHFLIYNIIIFYSRVLVRTPIKEQLTPLIKEFLIDIIFPMLVSSSKDVDQIKDSGEEYFTYTNDLMQNKSMKTYRTALVALIQKLTNSFTDLFPFIANFVLQYMDYYLKEASIKENINHCNNTTEAIIDSNNYYFLSKYLNQNSILASIGIERKIDFGLLIMAIFNDKVLDNKQCKEKLRLILMIYSNMFFASNHPLVIDKLCLVYFFYIDTLFKNPIEENYNYISSVFNFLLNIILDKTEYKGLIFQSSNTLMELLNDQNKSQGMMFANVININIEKIMMYIEESEVHIVFDFLLFLVSGLIITSQEKVQYNFITKVVNRIIKEIKMQIGCKSKSSIFLDKCFAILIKFLQKKNQYKLISNTDTDTNSNDININPMITIESIEELIRPIVLYISNPMQISFEDDIISLMTAVIIFSQAVTEFSVSLLPFLQLVCKKSNMLDEKEFDYLSVFFKYDENSKYTRIYQKDILDLIYLGYQFDDREGVILSLLITLQLLSKTKSIENTSLISLLSKAYNNIITMQEVQVNALESSPSIEDQFIHILSITVIALSMIIKPNATMGFLENNNYFINFIGEVNIIITKSKIYSERLFKIIIIGICALINNKETIQKLVLMNKLNQLLYLLFSLCLKHKYNEKNNLNSLLKGETECNFILNSRNNAYSNNDEEEEGDNNNKERNSDLNKDEDEDDDDKDSRNDGNNYSMYIRQSYYKMIQIIFLLAESIDEYKAFAYCLKELNANYYQYFFETLSNNHKASLIELLHIKTININYNNKILKVPRKIIAVKRLHGGNNAQDVRNQDNIIDNNNNFVTQDDVSLSNLGNEDNYTI